MIKLLRKGRTKRYNISRAYRARTRLSPSNDFAADVSHDILQLQRKHERDILNLLYYRLCKQPSLRPMSHGHQQVDLKVQGSVAIRPQKILSDKWEKLMRTTSCIAYSPRNG